MIYITIWLFVFLGELTNNNKKKTWRVLHNIVICHLIEDVLYVLNLDDKLGLICNVIIEILFNSVHIQSSHLQLRKWH